MTRPEARILRNRFTVFGTTDFTDHGHPDPLQCPAGMTRKSLALYYFSNGRAAEEVSNGKHSTLFHNRPGEEYGSTFKRRRRSVACDLLSPIVARQLQKYL
jgi:hypothetical protein